VKLKKMLYWHKDSFAQKSLSFAWCSSGKRDLHQVDRGYLITGKQVLYLLPNRTTTTGWEAKAYFGNRVAVFHSK
jgi:primosomal protein N'